MISHIFTFLMGIGVCMLAFAFLTAESASFLVQYNNATLLIGGVVTMIAFIGFIDVFIANRSSNSPDKRLFTSVKLL